MGTQWVLTCPYVSTNFYDNIFWLIVIDCVHEAILLYVRL